MAEYRAVPAADRDAYRAILRQAFHPERGPRAGAADDGVESAGGDESVDGDESAADDWPPELSDPRGVYADDELVATCKLYELTATVRGEWTTIGGLGGVATPPEHRRRGHARELLRGALAEYRDRGIDLVALWPSTARFYRGLGWGTANWTVEASVPPAQLSGLDAGRGDAAAADGASGRVVQIGVDDWERLRAVEVERAQRFGLSLRRSERWWRERTLAPWPDEPAPYVYGLERDGALAGYVLTEFHDGDDGRRLVVRDLAAVDRDAERALLGFLANHDSQVERIELSGPLARDLPELVPDPDAVDLELDTSEGPMVRFTDVERGLAELAWPEGADADLVLAVDDPLFDRNDGAFAVDVADGAATVEPAGDATADATLGIGALSRLAVGAIDPERAIRLGAVAVRDDAARDDLSAAFPDEPVCLREFF